MLLRCRAACARRPGRLTTAWLLAAGLQCRVASAAVAVARPRRSGRWRLAWPPQLAPRGRQALLVAACERTSTTTRLGRGPKAALFSGGDLDEPYMTRPRTSRRDSKLASSCVLHITDASTALCRRARCGGPGSILSTADCHSLCGVTSPVHDAKRDCSMGGVFSGAANQPHSDAPSNLSKSSDYRQGPAIVSKSGRGPTIPNELKRSEISRPFSWCPPSV